MERLTMERHFGQMIQERWDKRFFLCVGIDPVMGRIPEVARRRSVEETLDRFCCSMIDVTAQYAACFKLNVAFFERYGGQGRRALFSVIEYMRIAAPGVPIICDAKRGDIGNTNLGYVEFVFDHLRTDAVTLHPYLGREAMQPFLDRVDKGCLFLCKTSNPGAGEFQDLVVDGGDPLWLHVAKSISATWNDNGNCGLVLGATYPEDAARARKAVGNDLLFLVPGLGAQGGDLEAAVAASRSKYGQGAVFNSSRGILYASNGADFADAAASKAQQMSEKLAAAMSAP